MTRSEQAEFADDTDRATLPLHTSSDGTDVLMNPRPSVGMKPPTKQSRKTKKKNKRRQGKKRSLLKSRKVR